MERHSDTESVMIPNKEVSQEYMNAIRTMNWSGVIDAVEASRIEKVQKRYRSLQIIF